MLSLYPEQEYFPCSKRGRECERERKNSRKISNAIVFFLSPGTHHFDVVNHVLAPPASLSLSFFSVSVTIFISFPCHCCTQLCAACVLFSLLPQGTAATATGPPHVEISRKGLRLLRRGRSKSTQKVNKARSNIYSLLFTAVCCRTLARALAVVPESNFLLHPGEGERERAYEKNWEQKEGEREEKKGGSPSDPKSTLRDLLFSFECGD